MLSRAEELCTSAEDIANGSQEEQSTAEASDSEDQSDMDIETLDDVIREVIDALLAFENRAGLALHTLLDLAALVTRKLSSQKSLGPQKRQ